MLELKVFGARFWKNFFCVIIASLSIFYFIMALNYWICIEFRWFFSIFGLVYLAPVLSFPFFVSFLIEFERQRMIFSKSKDAANWKQPSILAATLGLPPMCLLPNSAREQDSSPLAWRGMWPSTKIPLGAAIPWAELPRAPKGSLKVPLFSFWLLRARAASSWDSEVIRTWADPVRSLPSLTGHGLADSERTNQHSPTSRSTRHSSKSRFPAWVLFSSRTHNFDTIKKEDFSLHQTCSTYMEY